VTTKALTGVNTFSTITRQYSRNLIGAYFLTGLFLYVGADDSFIGAISMVTFGANLLQLLAPLLLERFSSRKKLLIYARATKY
jgi:hypothetical protein